MPKRVTIRRLGSVYLHVLASSMLVTVIGLGSLFAVRVQVRSSRLAKDYGQARTCAVSAVELGMLHIKADSAWRTTWPNGTWMSNVPLGAGNLTLQGVDPQDSDLADSQYDSVILTGIGVKGATRHKAQVMLVPVIKPVEALKSCLHASGTVEVKSGKKITAVDAPVSTNGQLTNNGTIDGDAEAQSIGGTTGASGITGTPLAPAPTKGMPDADVISRYASKATTIPYSSSIEKVVIGPGYNPLGSTDPNGLYVINTGGGNMTMKKCRIYGTLVVRLAGGTLTLDDPVLLHNYRSDFPVLLVEGNLVIKCKSATEQLSEASESKNFNPSGAPYNGVSDTDKTDTYPNEIRGLVHVSGTLKLQQTARVIGAIICDGSVSCEENNTITYTPSLYACPPQWYTYVDGMKLSPGSWKQSVD